MAGLFDKRGYKTTKEGKIKMSPYYKYKKERLEKKFYVAKDTLSLLRGTMKEFNNTNSIFLKR